MIRFTGRYRPEGRIIVSRITVIPQEPEPEPVNLAPEWVDIPGSLGVYEEGTTIDIVLEATDPEADILQWTIYEGTLPTGLVLNPNDGRLSGTLAQQNNTKDFNFRVRVTDTKGNKLEGLFYMTVVDTTTTVSWTTDSGSLGSPTAGEPFEKQLEAKSV
jgi:hypothetical protein